MRAAVMTSFEQLSVETWLELGKLEVAELLKQYPQTITCDPEFREIVMETAAQTHMSPDKVHEILRAEVERITTGDVRRHL